MKISPEDANRLNDLVTEINERVEEFKNICRDAMSSHEYEQFRYNTMAHVEAGIMEGNEWVTNARPMEVVAQTALEDATPTECPTCGGDLNEDGFCEDVNCNHHGWHCTVTEEHVEKYAKGELTEEAIKTIYGFGKNEGPQ